MKSCFIVYMKSGKIFSWENNCTHFVDIGSGLIQFSVEKGGQMLTVIPIKNIEYIDVEAVEDGEES